MRLVSVVVKIDIQELGGPKNIFGSLLRKGR